MIIYYIIYTGFTLLYISLLSCEYEVYTCISIESVVFVFLFSSFEQVDSPADVLCNIMR